ncbi:GNAT family N-acetyltransferase [Bacillus sp. WMMC1349]|uniref:GNAT family N-acetyltransferase n=1 Tax=Bacillus sp. WMMC1349 TaxID=2736254 RepID=UPI001555FABD|nr:GNAT family N-acetyltransferase [Bacillus sp. WMMC1349]NPC92747.1 GNAT family N-acetyltransferase [Bacillus sp. WMMC1349]
MRSVVKTETNYLLLTCSKKTQLSYDVYQDDKLPQLFASHFIQLRDTYSLTDLHTLLDHTPAILKRNYVHVKGSISQDFSISSKKALFDLGYILDEELFYGIDLSSWSGYHNDRVSWGTKKSLKDGCYVMQLFDSLTMDESFAREKLNRRRPLYEQGIIELFVCYSEEGIPIGCAELYLDHKEKISKIEEVAILEPYQRKGYGTGLIGQMLTVSKQWGIKSSYLVTNRQAKNFYEKLGFQYIHHMTTIFKYLFSSI